MKLSKFQPKKSLQSRKGKLFRVCNIFVDGKYSIFSRDITTGAKTTNPGVTEETTSSIDCCGEEMNKCLMSGIEFDCPEEGTTGGTTDSTGSTPTTLDCCDPINMVEPECAMSDIACTTEGTSANLNCCDPAQYVFCDLKGIPCTSTGTTGETLEATTGASVTGASTTGATGATNGGTTGGITGSITQGTGAPTGGSTSGLVW